MRRPIERERQEKKKGGGLPWRTAEGSRQRGVEGAGEVKRECVIVAAGAHGEEWKMGSLAANSDKTEALFSFIFISFT